MKNAVHIKETNHITFYQLIMTFVQTQSAIDMIDNSPHAKLKTNLFSTPLIDSIIDSTGFDHDEQQFWSLAATIFGHQVTTSNNPSTPPLSPTSLLLSIRSPTIEPTTAIIKQRQKLKDWIRRTVREATQNVDMIKGDWHRAFFYMSTGQVLRASDLVQQLGDDALATMMVLHHQRHDIDVWETAQQQVSYWQKQGRFDSMPLYRRKMWYVLQGQLGYVDHIKAVVTQDLAWPQVVLLYALYGGRLAGDFSSGLSNYHTVITTGDGGSFGGPVGIHQLLAKEHTAKVPSNCLWYLLLQWWATYSSSSTTGPTCRKEELENKLPLRCRWLLLLHVPNFFEADSDTLETWKIEWCDKLFDNGLHYLAIQAGLYLSRPETKIKQMLSKRPWWKEHYLTRQLQIPPVWINDSKAVHAFNHGIYDKEVDYYLEANENEKAKNAILNHMIPALFLDGSQVETITKYIRMLTILFPDDMDLQQAISILHGIHIILNDYPRIISLLSSTPAQLATMVNEVSVAVQNLTTLTEYAYLQDPLFCSKVARQLIITASLIMDDEQLNHLLESCPVEIDVNEAMLEHISRAIPAGIGRSASC
ncbi:hypothetical protein BC941DRAFT_175223 [Chlamydoabsidia padenii]|nr:hypothetical protein BC941DRAFT_175223 [Chlamydoabsidia padenii]